IVAWGSMSWRTKALVDRADRLLDDSNQLISIMQSVRDPASAEDAATKLPDVYRSVAAGAREIMDRAKSLDRSGGGTQEGVDRLERQMKTFEGIMKQVAAQ